MTWILENWTHVLEAVGLLMAAATIITGLTPSPKDDQWLKKVANFLSIVTPKDKPSTFKVPFK